MTDIRYIALNDRACLEVAGPDARSFLHGLVTNDVMQVSPERVIYAALLTPQGRYLHDFFVVELAGSLVIDCEALRAADLLARLSRFKLRADVALSGASVRYSVAAVIGPAKDPGAVPTALRLPAHPGAARILAGGIVFVDPRSPEMGARAILPRAAAWDELESFAIAKGERTLYDRRRLTLGLPEGSRDMTPEKSLPLECNLDMFNAIDWRKGCYVGQEVTARMHYRNGVRKRVVPLRTQGAAPSAGTAVIFDEREVGEIMGGDETTVLALLNIELAERARKDSHPLQAGESRLEWPTENLA